MMLKDVNIIPNIMSNSLNLELDFALFQVSSHNFVCQAIYSYVVYTFVSV